MFKISFKETSIPCKVVFKEGRKTTVTYRGIIMLPKLWWYMPLEIRRWINHCSYVDICENIATNTAVIYARGTARCREDDKYDTLLGERIAEARSKYNMYRFVAELCTKLIYYYNNLIIGERVIPFPCGQKGLYEDMVRYEKLKEKEIEHIEALLNANKNGKE